MSATQPSNPQASNEARELLSFLGEMAGKRILSGQHNYPASISSFSDEAEALTGFYPAIWGQDFGFSADDHDAIRHRQAVVDEAVRQHAEGSVVTLMWHAIRPTREEPGVFQGDVIAHLTDDDWSDLLTLGTEIHTRWERQVDLVASFLAQLRDARVPVLWRPYHEMNGDWFWWCGRPGSQGYEALWRMLYTRLTGVHGLDNLLWVWNANAPREHAGPYQGFFPGHDVVDVLATDVYGSDYRQSHHDDLVELAQGKPIALGEVGHVPTPDTLLAQPQYVWFMVWAGFMSRQDPEDLRRFYSDPRTLNRPARRSRV